MKAVTIINETVKKLEKQSRLAASEGHEALSAYLSEISARVAKRAPDKCGMTVSELEIERSGKRRF